MFSRPSSGGSVPASMFKQDSLQDTIYLPEEYKTEFERVSVDPVEVFQEVQAQGQDFLLH